MSRYLLNPPYNPNTFNDNETISSLESLIDSRFSKLTYGNQLLSIESMYNEFDSLEFSIEELFRQINDQIEMNEISNQIESMVSKEGIEIGNLIRKEMGMEKENIDKNISNSKDEKKKNALSKIFEKAKAVGKKIFNSLKNIWKKIKLILSNMAGSLFKVVKEHENNDYEELFKQINEIKYNSKGKKGDTLIECMSHSEYHFIKVKEDFFSKGITGLSNAMKKAANSISDLIKAEANSMKRWMVFAMRVGMIVLAGVAGFIIMSAPTLPLALHFLAGTASWNTAVSAGVTAGTMLTPSVAGSVTTATAGGIASVNLMTGAATYVSGAGKVFGLLGAAWGVLSPMILDIFLMNALEGATIKSLDHQRLAQLVATYGGNGLVKFFMYGREHAKINKVPAKVIIKECSPNILTKKFMSALEDNCAALRESIKTAEGALSFYESFSEKEMNAVVKKKHKNYKDFYAASQRFNSRVNSVRKVIRIMTGIEKTIITESLKMRRTYAKACKACL